MLRGISNLISPELLMLLADMGHGEEILFADVNFPSGKFCKQVIHAPGTDIQRLLGAVMPLWSLDYKEQPLYMPESSNGCNNIELSEAYLDIIRKSIPGAPGIDFLPCKEFYLRAGKARVCVVTGDFRRFANIIVRKGIFSEYIE